MRVLHILDELKPSGAEAMLCSAALYWHTMGFQTDILATGICLGAYAPILEKAGYRIHHLPFSESFEFVREVYRFLKNHPYDAVHVHSERGNFWYAATAFFSGHRQIIRTVHNVFPFSSFLRIERYFQRWIMRRLFRVEMVTISQSVKEIEWEKFFNPSTLIPNWFDSNKLTPPSRDERALARKRLDIPEDAVVFSSIGKCLSQKNHSSIIEAVAKLPKDLPFVYLHVGQEGDDHPERRMAEALGVSSRCRFLGIALDVMPVLYASDVYVMPSVYEGLSVAAIEAMGAGVPAILSDVPGLRDFREVCKDIYWVEPTPGSIAQAIVHFIEMPKNLRQEIGCRLSSAVHQHFRIEKGAGAYGQLYRGLEAIYKEHARV